MARWKYRVTPNENYIDPEETLADKSEGSHIEHPVADSFFSFALLFFAAIFIFYSAFLFRLQILKGYDFRALARENSSLGYILPASRGIIFDRQGKELAYNAPEFNLLVITKYFPKNQTDTETTLTALSAIINESLESLKEKFEAGKGQAIFIIKSGLTKEQAISVKQNNFKGVVVVSLPKRIYPYGAYASHVTGYTGKVSPQDLQDDEYYTIQDRRGQSGAEESYEKILRGRHGWMQFSDEGEFSADNGIPGNNLVLNIDAEAQQKLNQSLKNALKSSGLQKGAALLQNPHTGAVIALVSSPDFDSNQFQRELSIPEINYLFKNKNHPLFNRIISGLYSPGSIIKPLYALAGLKEGVISPFTTITDTKGYITVQSQFDPSQLFTYRDWKIQGTINLRQAIANSSDIYFYSVGGGYGDIKGLGIIKIASYLKSFFADTLLKIDVPGEKAGFVPTPDWKEVEKNDFWYTGDTYNVSIGQGDLIVSPLWINSYISAVANGGVIYQPHIADKILDGGMNTVKSFSPVKLGIVEFSNEHLNVIREGMREAVRSGTARPLADLPVPVAAKTGTAEVIKGKSSNSLVSVYGPYQDPEFALTIIIEGINLNQQGLALKVAHDFLSRYITVSPVVTPSIAPDNPL